jgi:uncharacterized protein YecT (DUF1311 family)
MVRLLAALLLLAGCASAPAASSAVPGCDILRDANACAGRSNSTDESVRCWTDGQIAADRLLQEQLARIQPPGAPLVADTQPAWMAFMDADCNAVGRFEVSEAAEAACRFGHTLRRAQALWALYVDQGKTEVPCDCRP